MWSLGGAAAATTAPDGTDAADATAAADGASAANADGSTAVATADADSSKIASWVTQVSSLDAQSFADDGATMPEATLGSIEITAGTSRASVTIAKIGAESTDGDDSADADAKYICTASGSPYLFYVTKATAERLLKNSADFSK